MHPIANTNPSLDLRPSLKVFPLADILSLYTGFSFTAPARLHALVAFVTDTPESETAAQAKDARECVEEQFTFLKTLDLTTLHRAFPLGDDHIRLWLEAQAARYGHEHGVMPRARWQRRKNSHKL